MAPHGPPISACIPSYDSKQILGMYNIDTHIFMGILYKYIFVILTTF